MLHGQINEKNVFLQFSDNSLSHFNLPLTFSTTSLWSFPRIYEHTVTDVHPSEQHVWSPNTQEYGGHPLVCRCSVVTVRIITILCVVPLKLQCWVAEAYFLYKSSSPRASYEKNARKVKWGSQSVHHKSRSSTCAWTSAAECTKPFQTQAELLHDWLWGCLCVFTVALRNLSRSCGKLSMVKVGKKWDIVIKAEFPMAQLEQMIEFRFVIHNICHLV